MAVILPFRPNKLVYPCITAGINPVHFATASCVFSAIPITGNAFDLIQSKSGTLVNGSSISAAIDGIMGPNLNILATLAPHIGFGGRSTTSYTSSTIAVIVRPNAFGATAQGYFANCTNSKGVSLNTNSTGVLQWTMFGVAAETSSITLTAGVQYFLVASQNGTANVNYLALNLNTGQVKTTTTASSTPGTPLDGNYNIGSQSDTTHSANANIAAVAYCKSYFSMPQLLQWAQDPWSFWYPPVMDLTDTLAIFTAAGPSILPAGRVYM